MHYVAGAAKDSQSAARRSGGLLRVLGIAFGWAVIVGNTIGAGILRAPGELAQSVPSYPVFFVIWLVGGAYALLGALSLGELGAMLPESGGQTIFVRNAFGPYPGFAVAWGDWLSTCASAAAITIVLAEAVSALAPNLAAYESLCAALVIVALAAGQWRGVKESGSIQLATTALKAVAFTGLIVACFLTPAPSLAPVAHNARALTLAGVMLALQVMIFTYDGWAGALYFSGEMRDPGRDIPRSLFSGVVSVLIIYLLLNAAFLHLIPLDQMAGDPLVADTASQIVFGVAGTAVVRALIAISLLSAINSCILVAARVLYANGVARVNKGGTPTSALAVSTFVALAFLATGTFNQVIGLAVFFFVANYSISFASVFWLRRKAPEAPRPYRAWGFPVTTAISFIGSIAFLTAAAIAEPRQSAYALVMLALSYPIYRAVKHRLPRAETV